MRGVPFEMPFGSIAKKRWAGRAGAFALLALLFGAFDSDEAHAIDVVVSNTDELRQAILDANAAPATSHTITFSQDITLNTELTPIAANVSFVGNGHTISGNDTFQVFFVDSGNVQIAQLVVRDGLSKGGDGGISRAGGGLGAGGGLFVNANAMVTLVGVEFRDNVAQGGNGGADTGANVGGGGGGFHGGGGDFGGGGGGFNGNGGTDAGGGGGLEGNGLGSVTNGDVSIGGEGGGKFTDGTGGSSNHLPNGTGGDGAEFEGGGFGARGGDGGRFGGGGGSSSASGGAGGDFGGGGGSANINQDSSFVGAPGGDGGFGGGGGGSSNGTPSNGGFGGGNGTATGVGGAGSSLGGAVFVRTGGQLIWQLEASQATSGNSVQRAPVGSGQPAVAGSDLYLMSGVLTELNVADMVTSSLTGSIAGEGGLRKAGAGTLVLTGASSYSGGTTVAEGTLQGTTSSLQGAIATQAATTVRFDQSSSGSYSGVLSGPGTLEKRGTGTVTLGGANTYTGPTLVQEGVLAGSTASLPEVSTITVSSGATLRFDQGSNGTRSGPIFGAGTLDKTGGGRLTLDGDYSSWGGDTTVRGGELSLAPAAILAGPIDVRSSGRLGGAGTASGDVSMAGTLAPGTRGTQATLAIDGDLDLQAGSTLEMDVDDQNASDRVAVSGVTTLGAGATVDVLPSAGDFTVPHTYTLLTAGLLVDQGIGVSSDFCLFTSGLSIAGNSLQLTLTPDLTGLGDRCADTSNQRAVGAALAPVINDPALANVRASLNVLTEQEVPRALDLLGGEGLGGFRTARLATATRFLGSLSDRMRDPGTGRADEGPPYPLAAAGERFGGPLMPTLGARASLSDPLAIAKAGGVLAAAPRRAGSPFTFVSLRGDSGVGGWLDGFATFAGIDGDGNTHDTDYNLYGTAGGVDWAFNDHGMVGAAFGYTRSKLSVSDLATWGTGDTFQGALYGTFSTDLFYLGGVARYGYTQMDTTRRVAFGGLYETADGDFNGYSISGSVEAGLAAQELATVFFQPMASFQYTYLDSEEFSETGAPGVNLNVDSESLSSEVTNLGLRVYRPFAMDRNTSIIPELRVRWAHEFGDIDRKVAARFDDATTGPAAFVVKGAEVGRDVAVVGAGWTVVGEANTSLILGYDATLNSDFVAHAVSLGVLIYW